MKTTKLTSKQLEERRRQVKRLLILAGLYVDCWFVSKLSKAMEVKTTIIHPVVGCENRETIDALIDALYTVRANTYNKLGSAAHWSKSWMGTQNLVAEAFGKPETYLVEDKPLPSKLFEWTVQDTVKNILAQQEASKVAIIKKVYKRFPVTVGGELTKEQKQQNKANDSARKDAIKRLNSFDSIQELPWLHRFFREEFIRGHCQQNRQIVYQGDGYNCKRISRYLVRLEVQGIHRGRRISLTVKSNRLIEGQIRLIRNDAGDLEVHQFKTLYNRDYDALLLRDVEVGVDRGYTEVFYTSKGSVLGADFGKQLTRKTNRITRKGRNKNKLWALANRKFIDADPAKSARIMESNLGGKTELKRRNQDDAYVNSVINQACRVVTAQADLIAVESLVEEISSSKKLSRRAINKLQKWQKGTVSDRLSHWANRHATKISWVNSAYTSQVDHRNGTLLGSRNGDRFTGFDGVVLQSDENAALNVLQRSHDNEISRYMKYEQVQAVLLCRTACFLKSMGLSLQDALDRGWLDSKHRKNKVFNELLHGL